MKFTDVIWHDLFQPIKNYNFYYHFAPARPVRKKFWLLVTAACALVEHHQRVINGFDGQCFLVFDVVPSGSHNVRSSKPAENILYLRVFAFSNLQLELHTCTRKHSDRQLQRLIM